MRRTWGCSVPGQMGIRKKHQVVENVAVDQVLILMLPSSSSVRLSSVVALQLLVTIQMVVRSTVAVTMTMMMMTKMAVMGDENDKVAEAAALLPGGGGGGGGADGDDNNCDHGLIVMTTENCEFGIHV